MKTKRKIVLSVVVILVLVIAVSGVAAFRSKPVLAPGQEYLLHVESDYEDLSEPRVILWPQGPDDSYETREPVTITADQEQTILDILTRYEKRLSWEKVGWVPIQKFFPRIYMYVEAEMPEWLEAQVVIWGEEEIFDLVLGDGHAQQRNGYTFHPPYYTIENEEQLYEELSQVINLDGLLAERRADTAP